MDRTENVIDYASPTPKYSKSRAKLIVLIIIFALLAIISYGCYRWFAMMREIDQAASQINMRGL